jgi:sugar phosphate isomerase/epimerase
MVNSVERYFSAKEFVDECAEKLGNRIKSCHLKDVHLREEFTLRLEECGPGSGEFPIRYYAEKMHEIDPEMPMILEHLTTDEEYLKYLAYLKEELHGLYKTL